MEKKNNDQSPASLVQVEQLMSQIANNTFLNEMIQEIHDTHAIVKKISQDVSNISRMLYDSYRYASIELLTALQSQAPDKKRILLAGFYGAPNLGDELMCLTTLEYLREKLPDADFTIMCTNSDNFNYSDAYIKTSIIHYPRSFYDENVIANSFDAIIVGGGALIDDSHAARGGIAPGTMNIGRVSVELPKAFGMMKKSAVMLGLSTNKELKDSQYIDKVVAAIESAQITTIRDPYSLNTLIKCGIPENRLTLCADIVMSNKTLLEILRNTRMRLEAENESAKVDNTSKGNSKRIMITWINSDNDSLSHLASIVEAVASKNMKMGENVHVCLIPFLQEFNTDENMAAALRSNISSNANNILETPKYSEDIRVVCEAISNCDYSINMRYHGGLLAASLGLPGTVVTWDKHRHYPNKMKYLNEQFDSLEQVTYSRLNAMALVEKAFDAMFVDAEEQNKKIGSLRAKTPLERRIARLNEAEKMCIEAQEQMDAITFHFVKSIMKQG